jgi:hypothetical protein
MSQEIPGEQILLQAFYFVAHPQENFPLAADGREKSFGETTNFEIAVQNVEPRCKC